MAEKTKEKEVPATIQVEGGKEMSTEQLMAFLQKGKAGEILNSEYFSIEEGEEKRVMFLGMSQIRGKGEKRSEMVPAVKLFDSEDGKIKINADVVMVSTCEALALKSRVNVPLVIKCKGMIEGGAGEYRDLEIAELKA